MAGFPDVVWNLRRRARHLLNVRSREPAIGRPTLATVAVQRSQRLSYRIQNSRFASAPEPGGTISTLLHLEAEPIWIRLVYVNDRPEPWPVSAAAFAPTAGFGDGFEPVSTAGARVPWQRVTFAARGQNSEPDLLPDHAAAGELIVPGNPREENRPVHVLSDWMPVKAVPRQDGGFGWLLQVRTFSTGQMRFAASVGGPDSDIGRMHYGGWTPGDRTAGQGGDAPTRNDRLFACHGVQYITPTPGATVIGIGDSIIHSSCTTGELSGYGIRACVSLSTSDFPVSYVNEGFPGRNSLGFHSNGIWAIETLRPQVAIIHPWSQNEPWTAEMADLSFARAMAVADVARRQGCAPILTTAAPVFAQHPDAEPARLGTNDRLRAAAAQGAFPLLDLDRLWGTGVTPNAYQHAYDAGDSTHPNDRACAAAALVLAPMLSAILGRAGP